MHAYQSFHVGTTSQGNEQSLSVHMPWWDSPNGIARSNMGADVLILLSATFVSAFVGWLR